MLKNLGLIPTQIFAGRSKHLEQSRKIGFHRQPFRAADAARINCSLIVGHLLGSCQYYIYITSPLPYLAWSHEGRGKGKGSSAEEPLRLRPTAPPPCFSILFQNGSCCQDPLMKSQGFLVSCCDKLIRPPRTRTGTGRLKRNRLVHRSFSLDWALLQPRSRPAA